MQEINGQIVARFGRDEIVHGSSSRVLPEAFGNSKLISVWKLLAVLEAMDDYNWELYSEGHSGSLVVFPGHDQNEITALKEAIEREIKEKDLRDIQTGKRKYSKKIRTHFIGVKEPPIRIPIMEDFEKMQSLDFYKLYAEKICAVFGVTPMFVSVVEATRAGVNPRMQIDVQNRTTRRYQRDIEDLWNEEVLPKFGITDWVLKFNSIEGRDVLREAQTEHRIAATAMTWRLAGFDVEVTEDKRLIVSAKPVRPVGRRVPVSTVGEGKIPRSARVPSYETTTEEARIEDMITPKDEEEEK